MKRICGYYNPETHDTCTVAATHVVAMDYGDPGDTNVLSVFSCEAHLHSRTGSKETIALVEWLKRLETPADRIAALYERESTFWDVLDP